MSAVGVPRRGHYGFADVLRSEWIKLRSVRSTAWTLVITVVLTIGIAALVAYAVSARWSRMPPPDRLAFDPTSNSLTGLLFGQLSIGVLAVLVVTAEYSTGSIRATLSAAPRRLLVLAAKTLVFGAVAIVVGEVGAFVAFFVGQAVLAGGPAPHASLDQPGVLRAVAGGGLYITVLGLFALGLAAIIRHTAASIATFVGVLLVLPLIVAALPQSIGQEIGKFLPANIGATITSVRSVSHSFSPLGSLLLLCAYAAATLFAGGWLLVKRDA